MRKKPNSIPVNQFRGAFDTGIVIERIDFTDLPDLQEWNQPERHDRNSFFLLEKGSVTMEIDFTGYAIQSPALIYMHPDQVHRIITFEEVTVVAWAISNEHIDAEYLRMLAEMTPVKPLLLAQEAWSLLSEAVSLCLKLHERKGNPLHLPLLKSGCNTLIALSVSLFADQNNVGGTPSRMGLVSKSFKELLETNFQQYKRPADYAGILNLSVPYLNECVRITTGFSATHHIQQRVILEAKRLLYHSNHSVKEIAALLGYDDYPYFSRLFTKVAGVTPVTFRSINLDSSKPYAG